MILSDCRPPSRLLKQAIENKTIFKEGVIAVGSSPRNGGMLRIGSCLVQLSLREGYDETYWCLNSQIATTLLCALSRLWNTSELQSIFNINTLKAWKIVSCAHSIDAKCKPALCQVLEKRVKTTKFQTVDIFGTKRMIDVI